MKEKVKEKETKTQNKSAWSVIKKIINILINVLIVIVLIVSILIAVMELSSKAKGMSVVFGHSVENIQTDSMKGGSDKYKGGNLEKGDVIIGKFMDNSMWNDFEEGDIVTYRGDLDGDPETMEYICHRIVEVADYQGHEVYRTKGDNNEVADQAEGDYASYINAGDISSVFYSADYQGKTIHGFGKVLSFLQTKLGFFLCVLLPMIIFFLYELIRVVLNFSNYSKAKAEENSQEAEAKKQAEIDAAVAAALAEKDKDHTEEKEKDASEEKKEEKTPDDMTDEEREQFKEFLEFQKQQKAAQEKEETPTDE